MEPHKYIVLDDETKSFYQRVLMLLLEHNIAFMVGGAYAFADYSGIVRHTKDLDLFIKPTDVDRVLMLLENRGYRTEKTHPIWLAKAFNKDAFVDLIYRSGNGLAEVDDLWFKNAKLTTVLNHDVLVCPVEETILSKAFIMERERYDGADIIHYILTCAESMDWQRLLDRFGEHWRVLFSHLVLFGFVYPDQRQRVPEWVMEDLMDRLYVELGADHQKGICYGPLLSQAHYIIDTTQGGYKDARFRISGSMSSKELAQWRKMMSSRRDELLAAQGISLNDSRLKIPAAVTERGEDRTYN